MHRHSRRLQGDSGWPRDSRDTPDPERLPGDSGLPRDSRRLRVARSLLGDSGMRPWKRLQGLSATFRTLLGHFFRDFQRIPGRLRETPHGTECPRSVRSDHISRSVRGVSVNEAQKDSLESFDAKRLQGHSGNSRRLQETRRHIPKICRLYM